VNLDDSLKVRTRSGRQVSDSLPELEGLVDGLGGRSAILDDESRRRPRRGGRVSSASAAIFRWQLLAGGAPTAPLVPRQCTVTRATGHGWRRSDEGVNCAGDQDTTTTT
jgi:hypothetical protein